MRIAIIGGGAAGFFLGAQQLPSYFDVHIFEKAASPLQKVKVSGGGRCNVTHACFDPNILVDYYPRGHKELKSVFGRFQPGDTMGWFQDKGVPLKIQDDMRVFPISDNAADIVNCLIQENQKNGNHIHLKETVKAVKKLNESFELVTSKNVYQFDKVVSTTGASKQAWKIVENLGHTIVLPVPSLFTFNCKDDRIKDLAGTTFPNATVSIKNSPTENQGSLLITHWGFSGPAILVLSAWAARELYTLNYQFSIEINFIGETFQQTLDNLIQYKLDHKNQVIGKHFPVDVTKKFWLSTLQHLQIKSNKRWQEMSEKKLFSIAQAFTQSTFNIHGKSTFKDEFVTAGGVELKEIDFKTMESKIIPNLYFAGEIINIDAVTGGFNFQACWSEAYIIYQALTKF